MGRTVTKYVSVQERMKSATMLRANVAACQGTTGSTVTSVSVVFASSLSLFSISLVAYNFQDSGAYGFNRSFGFHRSQWCWNFPPWCKTVQFFFCRDTYLLPGLIWIIYLYFSICACSLFGVHVCCMLNVLDLLIFAIILGTMRHRKYLSLKATLDHQQSFF